MLIPKFSNSFRALLCLLSKEFQNFRRSIIFPGLSRESSKFGAPNVFFPRPCDFFGKKVSLKNGHLLETWWFVYAHISVFRTRRCTNISLTTLRMWTWKYLDHEIETRGKKEGKRGLVCATCMNIEIRSVSRILLLFSRARKTERFIFAKNAMHFPELASTNHATIDRLGTV